MSQRRSNMENGRKSENIPSKKRRKPLKVKSNTPSGSEKKHPPGNLSRVRRSALGHSNQKGSRTRPKVGNPNITDTADPIYLRLIKNFLYSETGKDINSFPFCLTVAANRVELRDKLVEFQQIQTGKFKFEDYSDHQSQHYILYLFDKESINELMNEVFNGMDVKSNLENKPIDTKKLLKIADRFIAESPHLI